MAVMEAVVGRETGLELEGLVAVVVMGVNPRTQTLAMEAAAVPAGQVAPAVQKVVPVEVVAQVVTADHLTGHGTVVLLRLAQEVLVVPVVRDQVEPAQVAMVGAPVEMVEVEIHPEMTSQIMMMGSG